MTKSRARLIAGAALVFLPACDSCGKTEKPFTPFGVASALPSATVAPSAEEPADAASEGGKPAFSPRPALRAPSGATRWSLEGRELGAPPGRAFVLGLAADFDDDGKPEAVAWTVPEKPGAPGVAPGELWLYPPTGGPRKLTTLPGFVPSGPTCTHEPTLEQTGKKSVTLDVQARCTASLLSRAPTRALVTLSPLAERPTLVSVRVANAALGDAFTLSMDSTDRDGDGRDDARLTIRQKPSCRSSAPEASCNPDPNEREAMASLVWLDRAAGTSRDASEPSASFARLAAWELGRSKNKKLAPGTFATVRNVRRLMSTLCAEAGVPRILEEDGSPIRCAPLAVASERLLVAEVQAALALGDVQAAIGALDRDGWYLEKAPEKRRDELTKQIRAATKVVDVPALVSTTIQTPAKTGKPRMSPLAFDAAGALLAQTASGLVRLATPKADPERVDAETGLAGWPLEIRSQGGVHLDRAVQSCDRNDVVLEFVDAAGKPTLRPRLPLLAARPGACAGGKAPELTIVPIGWKDDALEAVVSGERIGPPTTKPIVDDALQGTPRSPDGHFLVLPTSLGLLILSRSKPELWQSAAIGDARRFSDCVVANDARAVACVQGTSVQIAERP